MILDDGVVAQSAPLNFSEAIQWLLSHAPVAISAWQSAFGFPSSEAALAALNELAEAGLPVDYSTAKDTEGEALIHLENYDWIDAGIVTGIAKQIVRTGEWVLGGRAVSDSANAWPYTQVDTLKWVDSTQQWAQQLAVDSPFAQPFAPRACIAEYQSLGRGRRGRQWCAKLGQCLMMTVSLSVPRQLMDQRLSPAFAVLLCDWLNRRYGLPAKVKWPNDLLFDGHKLAGFLVQSVPLRAGQSSTTLPQDDLILMMGLGLNLTLDKASRASIGQPVIGLRDTGFNFPSKATLAAEVLLVFSRLFDAIQSRDWQFLAHLWPQYDAYYEQPVRLLLGPDEQLDGVNAGIDADGQLLLRLYDGEQRSYCAGEVSLRGAS